MTIETKSPSSRRPVLLALRSLLSVVIAAAALLGCSVSAATMPDDTSSPPPLANATPEPLAPGDPTVIPVEFDSPLPAERPADFAAGFSQTGGSAPWSEGVDIEATRAAYEVWMNGVTYTFGYTPTARQLDFVYDEVRLGRFDEYRIIPFEEGEMIYDAGSTSYSASTGDYRHQLFHSDEEIDGPGTAHSPLRALSTFVEVEAVVEASDRLTIMLDESVRSTVEGNLNISFDLGASTFGMGEERWADTFEIGWSGGPQQVQVTIAVAPWGQSEDSVIVSEQSVEFSPGAVIHIGLADDGSVIATSR